MKAGIYYAHYQCLGHTARVSALLRILEKTQFSQGNVLVQASRPQDFIVFPDYAFRETLPGNIFSRNNFRTSPSVSPKDTKKRTACLSGIIKKHRPDIFITEYFPLGRNVCRKELLPALIWLKEGKKKIVCSAGYPVISDVSAGYIDGIIPFYDKLYIHAPREECFYVADSYRRKAEKIRYLRFFRDYSQKIVFTGYLTAGQLQFAGDSPSKIYLRKGKTNILVTRGGGAYYPEIISCAVKASDLMGDDFYFIIVSGPSTTESEWRRFRFLMSKKKIQNAVLLRFTPQMEELITKCDICVSTAAYNTAVLLMRRKKKSVIIPFRGYRDAYFREQPARARMLKDHIGSEILAYPDLRPQYLQAKILTQLKKRGRRVKIRDVWFNGEDVFRREISGLDAER